MQTLKTSIQSKAFTLAHQIKSNFATWKEAIQTAWNMVRENKVEVIEFVKVSTKKVTKRVITRNLKKYWTPKGGQNNAPQCVKVIDLAKVIKGSYTSMISFYESNLVSVAA